MIDYVITFIFLWIILFKMGNLFCYKDGKRYETMLKISDFKLIQTIGKGGFGKVKLYQL